MVQRICTLYMATMHADCMCCLQSAMAGEYGSFNTQAVPASVDIMGFSCRHAPTPPHPA